jgi:hypothetical protein
MKGLRLGLSLTGGSPAFNPATLYSGEAGGWYDPSDLSTMFQDTAGTTPVTADGQTVARINDKSGNGNHLTQATASARPTYKTGGYLLFDGGDYMTVATAAVSQPITMAAAVLITNTSGDVGNVYDGNQRLLMGAAGSNDYRLYAGTSSITGGTRNAAAHTMIGLANGASSSLKVDGVSIATGNPGASQLDDIYLGAEGTPSQLFIGRYYGGLIIARALTAGEESSLQSYLASKAGI